MSMENELTYLSVRIENDNKELLGSGIWWQPSEISEYIYVFTAGHIFQAEKIVICYINLQQEVFYLHINDDEISVHKDIYFEEGFLPVNDVAVIRVKREKIQTNVLKTYKFCNIDRLSSNSELIFRGFPQCLSDPTEWVMVNKKIEAIYENQDKIKNRLAYTIANSLNHTERDEEAIGLSGSGIFINEGSDLILVGIHTNGIGINSGLSTFCGMNCKLIVDICKENGWDKPQFLSEINGNLSSSILNFTQEVDNEVLVSKMVELVEEDFEHIIRCNFCDTSKICQKNNKYHECTSFRNSLLIILTILKYINNEINFNRPIININSQEIPVRYVCSDGESNINRYKIENFIHSLKTDYLMRNRVENKCLIIWNTKNQLRGKSYCNSENFNKIVTNIKGELLREDGFDILRGLKQPNKISIININDLLNSIEYDNLNGMIELIESII